MAISTYPQITPSTACKWGTTTTVTGTGVVISANLQQTAQTANVENANGAVTGFVIYDTWYTGTVEVVYTSTGTDPEIGNTLTVLGKTAIITDVNKQEFNKDTTKVTLGVTGFQGITFSGNSGS